MRLTGPVDSLNAREILGHPVPGAFDRYSRIQAENGRRSRRAPPGHRTGRLGSDELDRVRSQHGGERAWCRASTRSRGPPSILPPDFGHGPVRAPQRSKRQIQPISHRRRHVGAEILHSNLELPAQPARESFCDRRFPGAVRPYQSDRQTPGRRSHAGLQRPTSQSPAPARRPPVVDGRAGCAPPPERAHCPPHTTAENEERVAIARGPGYGLDELGNREPGNRSRARIQGGSNLRGRRLVKQPQNFVLERPGYSRRTDTENILYHVATSVFQKSTYGENRELQGGGWDGYSIE